MQVLCIYYSTSYLYATILSNQIVEKRERT
jgi:hypothetical protein